MSENRLYGVPHAEELHFELAAAYESQIEPWADEHDRRPQLIEEYTVLPPSEHMPSVDSVIEYVTEWALDNGMLTEGVADNWVDAAKRPEVVAAFQAALDALGVNVRARMADQVVATHTITWDDNGEPLVNGQPMYVPTPTPDPFSDSTPLVCSTDPGEACEACT